MTRSGRRSRVLTVSIALTVMLVPGVHAQEATASPDDVGCGTLTVMDLGTAPFRLLRYQPPVGTTTRLTVTLKTSTTVYGPQQQTDMATTAVAIWDLEVTAVDRFGVIRTDASLVDLAFDSTEDRPLLESVSAELARSVGTRGWWERDPFGGVTGIGVSEHVAGGSIDNDAVFIESLRELACHFPRLPDVAVGQGAEWEIIDRLTDQPLAGTLTKDTWVWLEADLPSMTLNGVRIEAPVKTTEGTRVLGEPGPLPSPGPLGDEAKLLAWTQEEWPSVTADLKSLYLKASGPRESRIAFEVTIDGTAQTLAAESRGRIEIASTPR